jgi:CRP/FNR family transcriptional regulator
MEQRVTVDESTNKVWYLKNNRLFADAAENRVADVAHIFRMRLLPRKTEIFERNDASRTIYLVKTGRVRIVRITPDGKEITVAVLGPGDIFGEETLFDGTPRTSHAVCMDETLICQAKADDLLALMTHDPGLAINVAKILSERLDGASATIEDLAYARIPDRIMHVFARLAADYGVPHAEGTALDVRLTHADIASLVGSTRETVSLEIGNLTRDGRLRFDGRTIVLPRTEYPQ